MYNEKFQEKLLEIIALRKKIKGANGEFIAYSPKRVKKVFDGPKEAIVPLPLRREQSNTSIIYDKQFILKLYRHVDEGINPECQIDART